MDAYLAMEQAVADGKIRSIGLSNWYVEELEEAGIETELVQFSNQIIEPCKACWACGGEKNCVHRKDIFRDIFEKMVGADGILLGSPVYSANISANMQAFLERAAVVTDTNRDAGLFRHKIGASVAAVCRGGALQVLRVWFSVF